MNNLDVLLQPLQVEEIQPCKVGRYILELEDPYKTALVNLVNTTHEDGGLSAERASERMRDAGLSVGATALRRHRERRCPCDRQVIA